VLRGWLDLSEKVITTLLVPVSAFSDTRQPDDCGRDPRLL
jgi:hypothetical protein